jgi:hypothetical protein
MIDIEIIILNKESSLAGLPIRFVLHLHLEKSSTRPAHTE